MALTQRDINSAALPEGPIGEGRVERILVSALEHYRIGRFSEAQSLYESVLAAEPDHFLCLHHLGLIAHQRGDHESAARLVTRAIVVKPDYVEAFSNLGAIYRASHRPDDAIAAARRAISIDPNCAQAYSNLGSVFEDQGRFEDALAAYTRAGALNPRFVEAHANAANLLRKLNRAEEAVAVCEEIISRRPDAAEPYFSLGNVLKELCRPGPAIEAYRRAIALRPDFAEVYANLGNVLQGQGAYEDAAAAYREALALRPAMAEVHANLGAALENLGRLGEAIDCFAAAVELDPALLPIRVWLRHKRRLVCDWDGIENEDAELRALMAENSDGVHPFAVLSMATMPADQLKICRSHAAAISAGVEQFTPAQEVYAGGRKLRIGYLSADFCRHATALLMAELLERHDKTRFEIIAYSHGPDDFSALGARLRAAFDEFVDVRALPDDEAAARIHADRIDVLVELKGYTKDARTGISARRPAPVQVNFLGFPATMGADFIDYIIADPFVLPMDQQEFFSERIAHLPHCYQPNDTQRLISDLTPTRAACGLPEYGFVFCSFNNTYKITPAFFDIWMRLLAKNRGSVLWLLDANELVRGNLRKEAARRGIDPDRLVFAPKQASPEHLARHRLADLFLDTSPYNAHTTASDALWAGLPLLTCAGETFAGRVAGSLLHAAGLPELVTESPAAYEALALRLASEPGLLQTLRHRLLGNLRRTPLFDIEAYTRHFEAALTQMWETWANGGEPRAFAVAPSPSGAARRTEPQQIARIDYAACPLCESDDIPLVLGADCTAHALYQPAIPPVMNWRECGACGHVFTEGYFSPQSAAVIFARTHPNQTVGHDMERQRPVSGRMVERVARHVPRGRWLDVGFGNGSLLFTAEEWGYQPVGLDLRAANVETLKSLGFEAHCVSIEDLDHSERYDVVSMADVLEHLPFPRRGLAAAGRLIRPRGALFLSMPNMDTMVWRLLHANRANPYWGEIEHYHNFTRARLYTLLDAHGFEPVDYSVSERYRLCMQVIAIKRE